jgi:cell division protein FtsZ
VRTIMSEGGAALMAVGRAEGDDRARRAAEAAISSALLDVTIDGARGILFNITGGHDLSLFEVNEAAALIKDSAHPEVNLIFGAQIDDSMGDEVRITVIATGFEQSRVARKMEQQPAYRQPITRGNQQSGYQQPSQYAHQSPAQPPQAPAPRAQEPQPPQEQPRPAQPPAQQPPQQRPQQDFSARVYEETDIDIPAFLRKRR